MNAIVNLITVIWWIIGVVLAKGFWSTLLAITIPLWSFYLVIEYLVLKHLI